MQRKFGLLLILVALATVSCHHVKPKVFDPSLVDFEASYNPYLENQFYPSLVMGVAGLSDKNFGNNDTNALFTVSVTAPASNSVLRITIDSSNLNYVTIFQEVLPVKDMRYTFCTDDQRDSRNNEYYSFLRTVHRSDSFGFHTDA